MHAFGRQPQRAPDGAPLQRERHRPEIDDFSLHAAVRVEAHDCKRLEHLCRYIKRPALSDERSHLNGAGKVEIKLQRHWGDVAGHEPAGVHNRRADGLGGHFVQGLEPGWP